MAFAVEEYFGGDGGGDGEDERYRLSCDLVVLVLAIRQNIV